MRGLVAAGHPETARAASAVLADGGNAVDAALAGLCAATVVEPVLASLGGGGFLVARPAEGRQAGRTLAFDFFVQTPQRRRPEGEPDVRDVAADFGPAQQAFHVGLGTIATPGAVKGLFEAHRELGRMPIRRIVEPAIALARTGVAVNPMQAYILHVVRAIIGSHPSVRALFASPERPDEPVGEGELLRLPDLADALEILAIEGPDLFYRGEMGRRLTDDCAAAGGHMSMRDLRDYRMERREPLALCALGARIELNPPPAMGGVLVAFGLRLWEALGPLGGGFGSTAHAARLITVMRATTQARLATRANQLSPERLEPALLDPQLVARYRAEAAAAPPSTRGTTQISVIDGCGGAASLSVSNGEGSGYVLPGTGIILNNMLGEADLCPDGPARWQADARMASMMTPALVLAADGSVTALGSGGSNRIRTAMLQALLNLLAFGMRLEDAVAAPRLHLEDETLSFEPGFPETVLAAELADAHRWPAKNMFFGGVHAVRRSGTGVLEGAGDERRGGVVAAA